MSDIDDIREAFHRIHRYATGQSDRAYMSIPADPNRDADLILSAAIDDLATLRAQSEAAAEATLALAEEHARVCRERDEAVGLLRAVEAHWSSGNFSRESALWDAMRAILKAVSR